MNESPKPRTVFFSVERGSEDEAIAPNDPDPTGRSRPVGGGNYFAGRAERRIMVSNPDHDGLSLTVFKFAPGTVLPRHRHNVEYIEFVLEGEVHHGNRVIGAGEGVYRSGDTPYTFTVGPQGATIADFRGHTWYTTEYADPPEEWPPHALPLARESARP
jgi:hypothetical protein